jgi:hypothetical protein
LLCISLFFLAFCSFFFDLTTRSKFEFILYEFFEALIFQQWFKPFDDLRARTVTLLNTGSTDHISFNTVGLPGFQFVQDRLVTQHSNMDSYDHLMPDDLKQSATIVAAFVYNTAMRDALIPRKPLPVIGTIDPVSGFKKQ